MLSVHLMSGYFVNTLVRRAWIYYYYLEKFIFRIRQWTNIVFCMLLKANLITFTSEVSLDFSSEKLVPNEIKSLAGKKVRKGAKHIRNIESG